MKRLFVIERYGMYSRFAESNVRLAGSLWLHINRHSFKKKLKRCFLISHSLLEFEPVISLADIEGKP